MRRLNRKIKSLEEKLKLNGYGDILIFIDDITADNGELGNSTLKDIDLINSHDDIELTRLIIELYNINIKSPVSPLFIDTKEIKELAKAIREKG